MGNEGSYFIVGLSVFGRFYFLFQRSEYTLISNKLNICARCIMNCEEPNYFSFFPYMS